ncbi:MAG TPA: serine hydrolase domain-containing protein [Chitinivibrionales bacterium]|nr:serine hydrolase domain-containing protein [Chitinivibrionales bacterium]
MDLNERAAALVQRAMKTYRITGASISIINDNAPVILRNFGYADKKNNIPVNDSTLFKIGSITKVFTASAVMQLAEQGKIDIDKPIKEYIPEFSVKSRFPSDRPITIRDILCHHSGLPCDNLRDYYNDNLEAFHSVLPYLQNAYAICPPGQMFYYSNLGYELLGVLISRISGMPFHKYIDDVLLRKIGMTNSAIGLSDEKRKALSKPYRMGKEQFEGMMKAVPEGGIHSTAPDMALFMNSILNSGKNIFVNNNTFDMMLTPQYPDNAIDMSFICGLGWFMGKPGLDHGGKVIWHDGGTPHFFSLVVLIPERKLGITLLTNSSTGATMNHTLAVDILQLFLEEGHHIAVPPDQGKMPSTLSPEKMKTLTGRFFTLSGMAETLVSGKHLVAKLASGIFRLQPHSDGWFGALFMLFGFLPLKLKKLSMLRVGIVEINGEKVFALEQLGFRSPQGKQFRPLNVTETWKQRSGNYVCVNEERPRLKSFKLQCTHDGMALSSIVDKMGRLKIFLDAINDSEAITIGYGRFAGETIIASKDIITMFGLDFKRVK